MKNKPAQNLILAVQIINKARQETNFLLKGNCYLEAISLISSKSFHSETFPVETSEAVCEEAEDFIEKTLNFPSNRLAVYGSLIPGGCNDHILKIIPGVWTDGAIEGEITLKNGYKVFTWNPGSEIVDVKIFCLPQLPGHFKRIDAFEGENYERILVPVKTVGGWSVSNIYARASQRG